MPWRVIPSGDPRIAGLAQPGEECLEPVLGVIDWQQYLASLDHRPRRQSIRACERELMLTDRRMLAFDYGRGRWHEFPLAAITDVSLIKPPGKPLETGECVIRILWTVEDGRTKVVDYGTGRRQAESFVERLGTLIGTVKLARFWAEHDDIKLSDPRAAELLALMHEAGQVELPPVLFMREAKTLLPPVALVTHCPECGGRLRIVSAASCCRQCGLVWCDPGAEPEVDSAGRLIGTRPHLDWRDRESVRCYALTRDGAI